MKWFYFAFHWILMRWSIFWCLLSIYAFFFFFTDESFIRTRQDVSTPFPFIQKVEHFKYINFSLQQNFFQSGPRNCLSLQDSRFSNTYAPITAKRAYCEESRVENREHRPTDKRGLQVCSEPGWSALGQDRTKGRPPPCALSPSEPPAQGRCRHTAMQTLTHRWPKDHTPSKHSLRTPIPAQASHCVSGD